MLLRLANRSFIPTGPFAELRISASSCSHGYWISHGPRRRLRSPRDDHPPRKPSSFSLRRRRLADLTSYSNQIYASRPLFNQVLSTPRAGARLTSRLRNLLLHHGSFVPPPSSLNSSSPPVVTRIPRDLLTEELVEEIKTRVCFVGEAQTADAEAELFKDKGEMDIEADDEDEAALLKSMEKRYSATTTATTISIRVPSLNQLPVMSGVGRGWLQIPGWVRERAAEVLFEEGDDDEGSLPELILQSLMKVC
jgi:actin-related protein 10